MPAHQSPSTRENLLAAIDRLGTARVGVVGDLLVDLYISGLSDRVSREAPVLVLQYEQEWLRPGGAANVAANVAALGAAACVVGLVGDDEPGRRLLDDLARRCGAGSVGGGEVIVAPGRTTISKTRFLAGARLTHRQQVLRLDRQPAEPPSRELVTALSRHVAEHDSKVDAWIASDYGYGSFDEQLCGQLREIARHKPVVADSRWNLAQFAGLTLLKPNEEEASATAAALNLPATGHPLELARSLAQRLDAKSVLVTLGNKGMALGDASGGLHIPAVGTEEIVDLTGAGDSVAAALATALAAGCDVQTAARLANHAGGIVVMKEGAATASIDELRASVIRSEPA